MKGMVRTALALVLLAGSLAPLTADAKDLINYYNGHVVEADLTYIAGDLIYYKTNVGKEGSTKRIQLTNRQDVVRTHIGQKYLGEVVFLDSLWVELKTPVGQQKIRRIWVDDIVLGSPKIEGPDFIETPTQLLGDSRSIPLGPGGNYGRGDCPPCADEAGAAGGPYLPSESYGKPMVEAPPEAGLY